MPFPAKLVAVFVLIAFFQLAASSLLAEETGCTARAYSCDNLATLGGNPCFAPGDAKHMTVGFVKQLRKPGKFRLKDPGSGVPVEVLGKRSITGHAWLGEWYQVRTAQGNGWIKPHFVRLDASAEATCKAVLSSPN